MSAYVDGLFGRLFGAAGAAPRLDWRLHAILSFFALALPTLRLPAPLGVVALLLLVAALAALAVWQAERRLPALDRGFLVAFGVLLAWCAIASLWSFHVVGSLILTVRIAAVFVAGLAIFAIVRRLGDDLRERIGAWMLAGLLLALALTVAEMALDYPMIRFLKGPIPKGYDPAVYLNRGATTMAMVTWPVVAWLWYRGRVWAALALPALVLGILYPLDSTAAVVGLAAGMATGLVALARRWAGRALLVTITLVALFGSPLFAKQIHAWDWQRADWLAPSAQHRVEIWNFTVDLYRQKPLRGWGFDSSRAIAPAIEAGKIPLPAEHTAWPVLFLHPHNGPIQILFELGAVGAVAVLPLLWLIIARLDALPTPSRVSGQALFATTAVLICTAYGVWQNQWLAMMISAALLLVATGRTAAPAGPPRANTADRGDRACASCSSAT